MNGKSVERSTEFKLSHSIDINSVHVMLPNSIAFTLDSRSKANNALLDFMEDLSGLVMFYEECKYDSIAYVETLLIFVREISREIEGLL